MKVASFSPIGLVALAVLVAQMSGLTLAMRASRTQGQLYSVSAAVLLTEGLKLAACVAFAVARRAHALGGGGLSCAAAWEGACWVASTAAPIALPALLFVATQQLNLCAATELDAVTFQVTNQLKILPTAWFSVLTLNRSLPAQQWASLPVLAVGVAVVNLSSRPAEAAAAREHGSAQRFGLGLAAALAAACFSGYASVYVERLLKTERLTWPAPAAAGSEAGFEPLPGGEWEALSPLGRRGSVTDVFTFGAEMEAEAAAARGRLPPLAEEAAPPAAEEEGRPLLTLNIQLAAWGAAIAAAQLAWQSPGAEGGGLLAGFNAAAWAVVWLQALGGLVVGLVLKYTDNIVKGFATAVSILLSCVLERAQQRAWPSPSFLAGLSLVMASFALFSGPEDLLTRLTSGPALQAAMEAARAARGASAQAAARAAAAAAVTLLLLYAALSGGGAGGWAGGAGEVAAARGRAAGARGVPAATIAPGQMQARWAQARAAGAETTSADVGGEIDLASVRRARLPPPPPPPAAALPNATARAWGGDADAHAARQRASIAREAGAAEAARAEALAAEMELRQADSALNPDEAAFAGGMAALETELGSFGGGGAAPPPRAAAVGPLSAEAGRAWPLLPRPLAAEAGRAWPLHREALGLEKKLD